MDQIIDMPLLEQVVFGVVFSKNDPMMLVFACHVAQIAAAKGAHPLRNHKCHKPVSR